MSNQIGIIGVCTPPSHIVEKVSKQIGYIELSEKGENQ